MTSLTEKIWKNSLNGWTGLASQFWPMASFPSYKRSSEPVLVSYVSRQDRGSSSSPESVTDPGSGSCSDPWKKLQLFLQYSSVGHSSSGLTFPLRSCNKSQTNTQHHLVKQHKPELTLIYPGYFLYEEKLGQENFWVSHFKTTFILRNVPCSLTSQGSPKFRYHPIISIGPYRLFC